MRKEVIGDCEIWLGDCEEVIPQLPPVNAVIFDPPYLLSDAGPGKSHYGMSLKKFDGDAYKNIVSGFDFEKIFPMLEKICSPFNMFCFCSNKQISKLMGYHELKGRITTLCVWHKVNAAPFANGVWRGDIEYVVHTRDAGATFTGNAEEKKKVSEYPIVCDLEHPSVKPLELMKKYVKICTNPGDIVLDPYLGTGTTLVACARLGRRGIGIEKELEYFDIACKRLEMAYAQPDMLVAPVEKLVQAEIGNL